MASLLCGLEKAMIQMKSQNRLSDLANLRLSGGRTVREFGTVMYPVLYQSRWPMRTYCGAQDTLLSVSWEPGWDRGLGENGCMCMDD